MTAHSKEIMSEPIETQGVAPAILIPEDQPLDSSERPIKEYVVARETKRQRTEKEEEEEGAQLVRKKQKVSHEMSKDAAKDKKSKNVVLANSLEFVVATSSFDRLATKLAKKSAKLKKKLKVVVRK